MERSSRKFIIENIVIEVIPPKIENSGPLFPGIIAKIPELEDIQIGSFLPGETGFIDMPQQQRLSHFRKDVKIIYLQLHHIRSGNGIHGVKPAVDDKPPVDRKITPEVIGIGRVRRFLVGTTDKATIGI